MRPNIFEKLHVDLNLARDVLQRALARHYPEGARIAVLLRHGQENPSLGSVIGHDGDGYVIVRLESKKSDVKRVFFKDIVRRVM